MHRNDCCDFLASEGCRASSEGCVQRPSRGLIGSGLDERMRPAQFKGRHFEAEIIVVCVRWYMRYPISLRQLEEIMAERNPRVGHVTISRSVQRCAPELQREALTRMNRYAGDSTTTEHFDMEDSN